MTFYIFCGQDAVLSFPVMIDAVEQNPGEQKHTDCKHCIIEEIASAGSHKDCNKAANGKYRHKRI